MNKKQKISIFVAIVISLFSIMINPTIFWKNPRDIEHNKIVRQRADSLFIVYIPFASFIFAGSCVYFFRNKRQGDKKDKKSKNLTIG